LDGVTKGASEFDGVCVDVVAADGDTVPAALMDADAPTVGEPVAVVVGVGGLERDTVTAADCVAVVVAESVAELVPEGVADGDTEADAPVDLLAVAVAVLVAVGDTRYAHGQKRWLVPSATAAHVP
jgi:hypothetical protein